MSESTELAELQEKVKLLERILELKKQIAGLEKRDYAPLTVYPVYRPYDGTFWPPYPDYPTITWSDASTYSMPITWRAL